MIRHLFDRDDRGVVDAEVLFPSAFVTTVRSHKARTQATLIPAPLRSRIFFFVVGTFGACDC